MIDSAGFPRLVRVQYASVLLLAGVAAALSLLGFLHLIAREPLAAWSVLTGGLGLGGGLAAVALLNIRRWHRSLWKARALQETSLLLRQSEERLRQALKPAPVSLFTQDCGLRYTWMFKSRMGLMPEQAIGRSDAELLPAADAAALTAIKRDVLTTGIGRREVVRIAPEGRTVHLDLTLEPLHDGTDTTAGIVGFAIDVTEEREAREVLAAAQAAAERANEAKSRFLAAASHDLRQPLQATRLFLEVLLLRLSDPNQRAIAERAQHALEATDGLLNTLLDISTLEAGVVTPDVTVFAIDKLLLRLGDEALAQADAKGVSFHVVPCRLMVRSDLVLLERMVRNLLANALRYTERGGILLGCRRRGRDALRIDVCDTGPGIPEDKLDMIFEDFFQLGNSERDPQRGLGLGLSVVQRTGRLLGHPVGVRSRLGRGSTFSITVPLALPAAEQRQNASREMVV